MIGESGLAAPIHDRTGEVVAALGIVIPESQWPTNTTATTESLRQTARAVSRELGASS